MLDSASLKEGSGPHNACILLNSLALEFRWTLEVTASSAH